MKLMKTEDAVGQVLCHDITQIIKGVTKDALFRKGHIIKEQDIPVLLSLGKDHIYIWEQDESMLHENEAAEILCDISKNEYMDISPVKEGKIQLTAQIDGLLKVDTEKLHMVNGFGEMIIASRHGNFPVKAGDAIAAMRIIPLVIKKEKMEKVRSMAGNTPIFTVKPYQKKKAAIITTGNEVYYHRIEDQFTPVIKEKLKEFPVEIIGEELIYDNVDTTSQLIRKYIERGADMIICTGGMSVDPDDRTPAAIQAAATSVVTYGAPVLPGAMFMMAYGENQVPIMGLPGCVMYAGRTIFDLILPRVMADDVIIKEEIDKLGEGGLCLSCKTCTFPNCGFGK